MKHLSLSEYLYSLEMEFLTYFVRYKTYPNFKNDRSYFYKILQSKRKKILDIAPKINSQNIFDDENHLNELLISFYNGDIAKYGIPNFVYKDENQKNEMYLNDILNYLKEGQEVCLKGFLNTYKIFSYNKINQEIELTRTNYFKKDEEYFGIYPISDIKRPIIFEFDFLKENS